MMTPKERVKLNIYKQLLEEEKKRNKKMSWISMSLFVLGIFTTSTYNILRNNLESAPKSGKTYISDLQDKGIMTIEQIFEQKLVDEKQLELTPDEFFAVDIQG